MAKYDWKQLEREYVTGNAKSVSQFLASKGIRQSGSTKKFTKGWKEKKVQKAEEKSTKILDKIIEKQVEKEVKKTLEIKETADELMLKIQEAILELNKYIAKNTHKKRTVTYNIETKKPEKETIDETESFSEYIGIIDKKGLKSLTSALKDLNEIYNNQNGNNNSGKSLADSIQEAYENREKDQNE